MRQLRRVGLGEAIDKFGALVGTNSQYLRHDGTPIAPVQVSDLSGWNATYGMHRADMVELLSANLPAGIVRCGHRATSFSQDANKACVTFANGTTIEADVVVACDGIHSELRPYVFPPSTPVFHALWADANIDVVGIDAYFPLTDVPRAVYDKAAIAAGWSSGELIDYYYATQADRDLDRRGFDPQRSAIDDPFYAIKDIRFWWENQHVPRVSGTLTGPPTAWAPRSKPIWFTEYGVPSVNCATNQPNVFIDPKSSESFAPYYEPRR